MSDLGVILQWEIRCWSLLGVNGLLLNVTVCSLFWHDDDDDDDFIFFLALKQRWHLHIQMEFTTTEHSGLLLFNGRYDGKHDFIAVEVKQGQVWFRFSLFSHVSLSFS